MWPYYPELLARPVPRYTSFPTAAEFTPAVGQAELGAALAMVTGEVSLYLHIPFCEQICWYCGCNTGASNRKQRLANYLDSLQLEIALTGAQLPSSTRVRRIAFGGGSPNAIAPVAFVRLMDALTLHFPLADPLISVELDPRTLHPCWGAVLAGVGVTHASLGVQTFAPALQRRIGREQPLGMIARAVELLRGAGVRSLNFDLMYGLPGQSLEDLTDSLERTAEFGADRVALFGYAHVPHLVPRQKRIDAAALPGQAERFSMAELGHATLTGAGYEPVGFDHFALPGDGLAQAALSGRLKRNFQGFTDDQAPVLLGLGASAISNFPDLIVQNEKNAGRYRMQLSQGVQPVALGVFRSADDRMRGAVIEGLLCHGHSPVAPELLREAWPHLEPFFDHKLCTLEDELLVLDGHALPYARSIAAAFDPYRLDSSKRFSSAV